MANEFSQDYNNPVFLEQERDKIAMEVVTAFRQQLERMPSTSRFCQFLKKQGLYIGPYVDTPEDQKERFARVAENTGARSGYSLTAGLYGPVVFVPGMLKHAWNSAASEINGAIAGMDRKEVDSFKSNSRDLERMAWKVSAAIDSRNLNYALSAIYGQEWEEYDPRNDTGNDDKFNSDM